MDDTPTVEDGAREQPTDREDRKLYRQFVRFLTDVTDYMMPRMHSDLSRQYLSGVRQPMSFEEFRASASPSRIGKSNRAELEQILAVGFVAPTVRERTAFAGQLQSLFA